MQEQQVRLAYFFCWMRPDHQAELHLQSTQVMVLPGWEQFRGVYNPTDCSPHRGSSNSTFNKMCSVCSYTTARLSEQKRARKKQALLSRVLIKKVAGEEGGEWKSITFRDMSSIGCLPESLFKLNLTIYILAKQVSSRYYSLWFIPSHSFSKQ